MRVHIMEIIAIISVLAAIGSAIAAIFSARASNRSAVDAEKSFLYNKEITKANIGIASVKVGFDKLPQYIHIFFSFTNTGKEDAELLCIDCRTIKIKTLKTEPLGQQKMNFLLAAGTPFNYSLKIPLKNVPPAATVDANTAQMFVEPIAIVLLLKYKGVTSESDQPEKRLLYFYYKGTEDITPLSVDDYRKIEKELPTEFRRDY